MIKEPYTYYLYYWFGDYYSYRYYVQAFTAQESFERINQIKEMKYVARVSCSDTKIIQDMYTAKNTNGNFIVYANNHIEVF